MPSMYQVYSQQRPGRPRWALGSSAALLLATVGLAAALIHHKTGGDHVVLKSFANPAFRAKLPLGWEQIQEDMPENTLLALAEPAAEEQGPANGRRLYIFGRTVLIKAPVDQIALAVARDYAMELFPSSGDLQEDIGPKVDRPAEIAGFPAFTITLKLSPREGAPVYCLVRTAMISRFQVVGVALLGPGEPQKADFHLLARVSQGLELPTIRPGGTPVMGPVASPEEELRVAADRLGKPPREVRNSWRNPLVPASVF